jgi:3-deoxy-manno-octulosonate cytidylyltransferase (CMP-KDO synthetase)
MAVAVGIIPARYGSIRFPGKPLATLEGKPLVQHVWERAARARRLSRTVVATDDERIRSAVASFGGEALLTSKDHASGTDRAEEAVRILEERGAAISIVVNIQGDEPLVDPEALDGLVSAIESDPDLSYATLAEPFTDAAEILDPNTCKVVTDAAGFALYFSRSPVPFLRQAGAGGLEAIGAALAGRRDPVSGYHRHVGIYAFRRAALAEFSRLPAGTLERMEGLEQLRVLEAGRRMRVVISPRVTMDVDTPQDLETVRKLLDGSRLAHRGG